ncbi:MAG: efflux RND transporter permease subunit [Woeseiaceae bacterium]|nr:efflux RND transporter permease subunit [Woeseiaceae bacterium]
MIAWFARNSVAANLLLVTIVVGGLMAASNIRLEIFPDAEPQVVNVNVFLRGATPEDIELGVAVRIEEAVQDIEGIERITSRSVEGSTRVSLEIESGYDPRVILDEVKTRVDAINTFPAEAEKPVISLAQRRFTVIEVVVAGPQNEIELLSYAERVRDDLLAIDGVSFAEIDAARNYEIAIEASQDRLRDFDLTLTDISNAIRSSSLDLSAGNVRTAGGDVLVRSKGQAYRGEEFEAIVVKTNPDGSIIRVGDVATVIDGFEEGGVRTSFNGKNAVFINIKRTGRESAIEVAKLVRDYIAERQAGLPRDVELSYWDDDSVALTDRLGIMTTSALQGGILVILLLTLFLRPGVAFWVFIGIPASFLGAFGVMYLFDISLNLMSAFGFIIVLGIVVDDAIVTGENVYAHLQAGDHGIDAAINGTKEVAVPVTFGVLTTVAAFGPLVFIEGRMGDFMAPIALVVLPVLLFSLIESKLVLPAHLKHIKPRNSEDSGFTRWQHRFSKRFEDGILKYYRPTLDLALKHRYTTLAAFLGVLIVMASLVSSGWTRFTFFPSVEGETITASLQMPTGTPFAVTDQHVEAIAAAARELKSRHTNGESGESMVRNILAISGVSGRSASPNRGQVQIEMVPQKERVLEFSAIRMSNEWRNAIGSIPGAESLTFRATRFRAGSPIDIQLSGSSMSSLTSVSDDIKQRLQTYSGVFEIEDSMSDGKEEIVVELLPQGHLLGLTRSDVVGQVGDAFKGLQAQRIQRGRDDIRVLVRFPQAERTSIETLGDMLISTRDGREVPLSNVAELSPSRGPSQITRIDQNRTINVRAEVDKDEVNMTVLQTEIRAELDALMTQYPGIRYTMEGEQRERQRSFDSLIAGFIVAIFVIYCLLALPLKSYFEPLLVMTVIPFGVIGAILGHWIMGYTLSFPSVLGLMALTGVVINDSLVLVDFINQRRRDGMELLEAIRVAGVRRFRPIMLTSLTTFMGLVPLMLDNSATSQFLIPMGISLAFGIVFATLITLILVPTNLMIANDIGRWFDKGVKRVARELRPQAGA